jgi:hypothetical protein
LLNYEAYTKPKGKKLLGKSRRRGEENIKMNLKKGCEGLVWIYMVYVKVQWRAFVIYVLCTIGWVMDV